MTQTEFIKQYCANSNRTEEEMNRLGFFAVPCACGRGGCPGWSMESIATVTDHFKLYCSELNTAPVGEDKEK